MGLPEQGRPQEIKASHPVLVVKALELNSTVSSPLVAEENMIPGEVVPLNPLPLCKGGDKVEGPS